MQHCILKFNKILKELDPKEKARTWVWLAKVDGKIFSCPKCQYEDFYQHKKYPEIRECKNCHFEVRLSTKTIFQNSKIPMLTWLKAISLMTQGKLGISVLELQSELEMKSYGTTWSILHKIREAFRQRDNEYKLNGTMEKAGFVKVAVVSETKEEAQKFINTGIEKNSIIHADRGASFTHLENIRVENRTVSGNKGLLDNWLPWFRKFIPNAKSWIIGTHHGVEAKYLAPYLSKYTFRFNRRHDPDSMFLEG